jgi:hypothetical protein
MIDTKDLFLRMRGEFREIDIRFAQLRGPVTLEGGANWSVKLTGGRMDVEYFRLREKELKHLYAHAQAIHTRAVYRDRILNLEDLRFAAYNGRAFGSLRWDLKDRHIRLGPGRFGDTAYEYKLGLEGLDLGGLLKDITSLPRPLEGKLSGVLEGKGRTLMLERMSGTGKFRISDLKVGVPPRKDLLIETLGPGPVSGLQGLPLGTLKGDWFFQAGQLRVPSFEVENALARMEGGVNYQILTLDIDGVARLTLKGAPGGGRSPLAKALGIGGMISASFGGRVVAPELRYRVQRGGS